jgi:hypothetical protein
MSRWIKKDEEVQEASLVHRKWRETERGKEYKKKHAEYAKEWRLKNRDKFKATQQKCLKKARLEVLQHYSGKEVPECACCQENLIEFLQIDHVHNDGAQHRREIGMTQSNADQMQREGRKPVMGGTGFVYWLKKNNYPEGFQILCANCNYGKKNGDTCPHQL